MTTASVLIYVLFAEVIRRICLSLICAYTGPLSKIPGPFFHKFTQLPWAIQNVRGRIIDPPRGWFRKYGDVIRIAPREILVGDKDGIHKIIVEEDLPKSPLYRAVSMKGPHGLITSLFTETDKVQYKKKRRQFSPGFSIAYINGLEPLMQECIAEFKEVVDQRCEKAGGQVIIDVSLLFGQLTFDVMAATSFGGSQHLVATDDTSLRALFEQRLTMSIFYGFFPWVEHLPFMPPRQNPKFTAAIDDIISTRRRENESGKDVKRDLIQITLDIQAEDPENYTDAHVQEEMVTFMIAGADTTSVTATFTLLLLLNNPKKLEKLVAEIDDAFPSEDDEATFANTQELPYLNAVIKESMRVLPVVSTGFGRYAPKPFMLGNLEIPADTYVAAWPSAAMTDPRLWPDAHEFIPERWLEDYKGVEADRGAFFGFSAGTRNCIGQQFALKELRLILALVIRRYELSLVPNQSHKLMQFVTPKFIQGFYNVGFKRRETHV